MEHPLNTHHTTVQRSGAFNGGGRKSQYSPLWNFFNKHKQRGDPLEIFYGSSLQIELDAPLHNEKQENEEKMLKTVILTLCWQKSVHHPQGDM